MTKHRRLVIRTIEGMTYIDDRTDEGVAVPPYIEGFGKAFRLLRAEPTYVLYQEEAPRVLDPSEVL